MNAILSAGGVKADAEKVKKVVEALKGKDVLKVNSVLFSLLYKIFFTMCPL
jgi:ribosomal protein L12E/L44/L45/RPP1/RPP2